MKLGFLFQAVALLALGAISSASAGDSCGEAEKRNPIYQAIDLCTQLRSAKKSNEVLALLQSLDQNGFCALVGPGQGGSPDQAIREACRDPAGYICSRRQGQVFDSQCHYGTYDTKEIVHNPAWVETNCKFLSSETDFLKKHLSECSDGTMTDECRTSLRLTYRRELAAIERSLVYTPERLKNARALYRRVLKKYIQIIRASNRIRPEMKPKLIERLKRTRLSIDPKSAPPECANSSPTGPETAVYNQNGEIVFCIGAMVAWDQLNEYSIIHALAHEISHSIDPCRLDMDSPGKMLGSSTYIGLVQCLRGGKGADGCDGSVLHCNTRAGIVQYCANEALEQELVPNTPLYLNSVAHCLSRAKSQPNCPWGIGDPDKDSNNLADYRKSDEPIDQIQESFSDFMGAELAAALAREDKASGHFSDTDKMDALGALASDYTRIHGVCLKENTTDEHPSGYIRVDRTFMSSKPFRDVFCFPGAKPPHASGVATSCQGP